MGNFKTKSEKEFATPSLKDTYLRRSKKNGYKGEHAGAIWLEGSLGICMFWATVYIHNGGARSWKHLFIIGAIP